MLGIIGPNDPARAHDQNPVALVQDLFNLIGYEQDGEAARSECIHDLEDPRFSADIYAYRG